MRTLLPVLIIPAALLHAANARLHFQEAADYAAKDNGHAVIVMVNGKIVFERYDNGHTAAKPHHLASATKTFWGPVVAAMIEDKLISAMDELAADTLTEWKSDPRKSRITIRHLTDLTAGLAQDIVNLQGFNRATLKPDLFAHAVGLAATTEPGEAFLYGPSCYYALGALMKRKLAARHQTPLDYLKQRLLNPIGSEIGDWIHDKSGNPHMPNGCYITARNWLKFGQLLVDGGRYQKKKLLRADLLRFDGSKSNAGYGFTAWLNKPGGHGTDPRQRASDSATAGWIYPTGPTDLYMAGGAGGNRLIIIPSRKMVIVRMGETAVFSDPNFLTLLFEGKPYRRTPKPDLSALDARIQAKVDELHLPGAALTVARHDGQVLYEHTFGSVTMDTVMPIASASKWLTVAVVMALTDRKVLSLDDPVAKYLPEFKDGAKSRITIRQCLAVTSGMTERIPEIYNTELQLADVVKKIAAQELKAAPGTELVYGGTGFHVAGRVAEAATGRNWHALFEEYVTRPLEMKNTIFGSRDPKDPDNNLIAKPAPNPWLGGGALTSMRDYSNFMRMMVSDGVFKGKRVLSAEAIREMRRDQSGPAKVTSTLHPVKDTHYSLGSWVERRDENGMAHQIRDMGIWGWNPWVDYDRRYFAVFGVKDRMARLWGLTTEIEQTIQHALDGTSAKAAPVTPARQPSGTRTVTLMSGGMVRTYQLHVPASYDRAKPAPVVIMLHGGGVTGAEALKNTGWDRKGDTENFIAVFPDAIGRDGSFVIWNDGSGRGNKDVDDVRFVNAVIDDLVQRLRIDEDRVYLAGFAAGASMAFRAAGQLSDRVAALGTATGHLWGEPPALKRPVPLVCFVGTDDPINPMKAGVVRITSVVKTTKPQVRDSVRKWARAQGLAPDSKLEYVSTDVFRESFGPDAKGAEAVFYMVEGLGHHWPGGGATSTDPAIGQVSDKLVATDVMWDFFRKHPRANPR